MKQHEHPWILCGPWYRWRSEEDPGWGPTSRPILQKYASADFVNDFLENPQRSLKYNRKDLIRSGGSTTLTSGNSPGRRKVFLDTHSRFYLVVCELHCETAGFPIVPHGDACEAGFVVRRRRAPIPEAARPQFDAILTEISRARFRLAKLGVAADRKPCPKSASTVLVSEAVDEAREKKAERIRAKYSQAKEQLEAIIAEQDIRLSTQAWIPSKTNGDGSWQTLGAEPEDEMPQQIEEDIFPLYPLIPDPADDAHSSGRRSIWFGVLPTGSSDTDPVGNPRFDHRQTYEVRCFVRRHIRGCPKSSGRADCSGEVVWSRATASYQLASHFDLEGTSNKLVTIQLPDLNELKSQVTDPEFQIGDGAGVAIVSPPGSELEFGIGADGMPTGPEPGNYPSICFFAIPLITIVATFLLRLFLPIVVFLFGLWFLLRLKFCILPTVSFEGGLDLDLEMLLDPEIDFELTAQLRADIITAMGLPDLMDTGRLEDEDYLVMAQALLDQSADFSAGRPDLAEEIKASETEKHPLPQPSGRTGTFPDKTLVFYDTITEVPAR